MPTNGGGGPSESTGHDTRSSTAAQARPVGSSIVVAYVLVHGGNMSTDTWNRFTIGERIATPDGRMGGLIWDPVTPALKARGGQVFAPTLGDEHVADLTDNIEQISSIISDNDLRDIVLAGHSYGGMVITGTAARLADRVKCIVYVDAALPDPGQSLFDIIEAGGADPFSFEGLEAAPPYVEKLDFAADALRRIPKTYILCTESEFAIVTKVAKAKIASGSVGENWTHIELPSWHVPMANMPARVSDALLAC